jgi:hypothetical protein
LILTLAAWCRTTPHNAKFGFNVNGPLPVQLQTTNGCVISIPNDDDEPVENLAQKSPLLKANSSGV